MLTFGIIFLPFLTDQELYSDTFEISCVCLQSDFLFKENSFTYCLYRHSALKLQLFGGIRVVDEYDMGERSAVLTYIYIIRDSFDQMTYCENIPAV